MTSQILWVLIAIQVAMGAFDTLYHHELTERLAWRPSQQHELKLHAIRNILYAALFLTLGFLEVHGLLALLVMAVLIVEVVITLMDFVEEDMSRKLPASERVNHTLLALNYGAILMLLLPALLDWSARPTGVVVTTHGLWSAFAALSALGVALFGLRDYLASRRSVRLALPAPEGLTQALGPRKTVLVTGATGFIGQRLVEGLSAGGHRVIALVRDPAKGSALRPPFQLVTSLGQIPDDARIDAIVNLAGEPIADRMWSAARRKALVASRVEMTNAVVALVARLKPRPAVLVSGSAVGWYGNWQDEALTENSSFHPGFSHDLTQAWETAAQQAEALGVRVVRLRIGLVLGTQGGMLARLLMPFEFGLGGPIGAGTQYMPWIERDDLVRLVAHAVATPALSGAVNATAPNPVTNAEFTAALAAALRRPAFFRMPAAPLRLLAGDFADQLLLGGQRVLPEKALAAGFVFRYATIGGALKAVLGTGSAAALLHRGSEARTRPF